MGKKTYKEIMKFSVVGVINTGVDFVLFTVLFFLGFPLLASQSISYCCGVVNSYWLNRSWTFQDKKSGHQQSEAIKFIIVNIFTLLLTSILLILLVEHMQMSTLIAKFGCTGIGMGVNFLSSKFWVFQGVAGKSFD